MFRKFLKLLVIGAILVGAFFYLKQNGYTDRIVHEFAPCSQPLAYSIGQLDPGFNLSRQDFLNAIAQGEMVWEGPSGQNLFEYKPEGSLAVNFIYDSRQEATERMKKLGLVIDSSRSSYDKLKTAYLTREQEYKNNLAIYDSKVKIFDSHKAEYEKDVEFWNSQGGAPEAEYNKLQSRQNQLAKEAAGLNSARGQINQNVDDLNVLAGQLNKTAADLNLTVDRYNTIGGTQGEEFQEGLYKSDGSGARIEIYQFESDDQLIRVLAHELGHALGLDHVEDKEAIMFRLNQSKNGVATEADLAELSRVCTRK